MFKKLTESFNQLGRRFNLHQWVDKHLERYSDRTLRNISRTSTAMGALAVGHAGLWVAIGVAGAIALGLHAVGFAVPAFVGGATIALGALLAAKSVVAKVLFTALDKKCKVLMEKRGLLKPAPAPAPAPTTADTGSKVAAVPGAAPAFGAAAAAQPAAPPPAPAPDVKPPEAPKP